MTNPFFELRKPRNAPVFAKLPTAPKNASPVPRLTSLYHTDAAGPYGDRRYPGNCSGELIKDLLTYFAPANVLDPMTWSGTCRDVCQEMVIPCTALDIREGFNASDAAAYADLEAFEFIWAHPPYWRQKLYSEQPGDLSRTSSLDDFLSGYGQFIANCASRLQPGGKFAILMGDYFDTRHGYVPLVYHTKRLAFAAGLEQHCTDIIRFSHGASSSRKTYRSKFIPGLHDVCAVFVKPERNGDAR
ncbi:MAG TPA: hypothetical protein VHR66_01050 [Gemmataceae bacterium]|jgi:hypothetical protein|nr:hypothetical protein [Gemmataceae bacterium]